MRTINEAGIDLIKTFEGIHDGDLSVIGLQPKMCPAGVWTVGYGHALRTKDGKHFLRGFKDKELAYAQYPNLTELEACNLLHEDLLEFCHYVDQLTTVYTTPDQFSALVSFTYNLGYENYRKSTLRKLLNNKNYLGASREFSKWNKSNGKVLKGLTKRREAERLLFIGDN